MFKRMMIMVMTLLMITSTALAFDWEPYYVYESDGMVPMSEHDVIQYGSGYASWITDGVVVREATFPSAHVSVSSGTPMPAVHVSAVWRFDGTCSLLLYQPTAAFKRDVAWFSILYWGSSDTDPIEVYSSDEPCLSVRAGENTVAVLRQRDEAQSLTLLDGYGNLTDQIELPDNDASEIIRIRMIGPRDHWVQLWDQDNAYSTLHIVNGQIITAYRLNYRETYSVGGAPYYICDAMGADVSYPDIKITELTDDHVPETHYLYGNRVVITVQYIEHTEDGGLIITGSAVADSQKLYRVFRMYMTPDWNVSSIDVRDCSYHGNYNPGIVAVSELGYCVVYMSSYDNLSAPRVRVPFEDLPVAQNPGLGIR